jgi:hypothetical protein
MVQCPASHAVSPGARWLGGRQQRTPRCRSGETASFPSVRFSLLLVQRPHLHRLVTGGAGQALAIGAEADAPQKSGMSLEGARSWTLLSSFAPQNGQASGSPSSLSRIFYGSHGWHDVPPVPPVGDVRRVLPRFRTAVWLRAASREYCRW